MADYFHLYTNNPTVGQKDGTVISEARSFTSPLSVTLDASKGAETILKCAVRCDSGYTTDSNGITITPYYYNGNEYVASGGNVAKWKLAKDASIPASNTYTLTTLGAGGEEVTLGDVTLVYNQDFGGSTLEQVAMYLVEAFNRKSTLYTATNDGAEVTVSEKVAGSGHTPGASNIQGPLGSDGTTRMNPTFAITDGTPVEGKEATAADMKLRGNWVNSLNLSGMIGETNIIFWVKVSAANDEKPAKDITTVLHSTATIYDSSTTTAA